MAPARVGACRDGGSSARDAQRPPTRDSVTTLSVRIGPSVCRSVCRSRRQTEVRSGDVLVGKDRASPSGAAACCHAVPSSSGSEFARNHVVTGSIPGTSSMCGRRGPQVDFVAHPDPSPTPPSQRIAKRTVKRPWTTAWHASPRGWTRSTHDAEPIDIARCRVMPSVQAGT